MGEKADIEQKGNNWLEPMLEVILLSSQAKILLSQDDKTQIRAFLKNVGSNFRLNSRLRRGFGGQAKQLEISPKNGWRACVLVRRSFSEVGAGEPTASFPNWRCILEIARTEFLRYASRGSDWTGG